MIDPRSYLLCGTPRTGSTLLCSLLTSTGVGGYPESYFREPDQEMWAFHLGVPVGADGAFDYGSLVAAAVRAGTSANGVFAARIMWGTLEVLLQGISQVDRGGTDVDALVATFGALAFVHLQRRDVVAQAVSWARAEQTGYWQRGDLVAAEPHVDLDRITNLVRTIQAHNDAWRAWFAAQGVTPLSLTYEGLVDDPRATVARVVSHIGANLNHQWKPTLTHAKQADRLNEDWKLEWETAHAHPRSH